MRCSHQSMKRGVTSRGSPPSQVDAVSIRPHEVTAATSARKPSETSGENRHEAHFDPVDRSESARVREGFVFDSVRDDQGNGSLGLIIAEGVVTAFFLEPFVERKTLDCTMTMARRNETRRHGMSGIDESMTRWPRMGRVYYGETASHATPRHATIWLPGSPLTLCNL
jgi:hypothetical protein